MNDHKLTAGGRKCIGTVLMAVALFAGCAPTSPTSTGAPSPGTAAKPVPAEPPFQWEADFTPLAMTDFEVFPADSAAWSVTAEGIHCVGKPRGYLYSKQPYGDFTWRLEYRFPKPDDLEDETKFKGNTGFMIYIVGDHKVWPVSLEVQGKHTQMGTIKANGGATQPELTDNEAVRQKSRLPVGEWNRLEIVSAAGQLTVKLNGELVCTSQPVQLGEGLIGIQAEDHPFEVRRMRIRKAETAPNEK